MAQVTEFRELNDAEITRRAGELRQARFDKRLQHRIGELKSSAELANDRKDLARLLTVLRERQLKAAAEKK